MGDKTQNQQVFVKSGTKCADCRIIFVEKCSVDGGKGEFVPAVDREIFTCKNPQCSHALCHSCW